MKFDLANVKSSVAETGNKLVAVTKYRSPQIMFTAGIIAIGAGFVMAFKAGDKVSTAVDTMKKDLDDIHADRESMSEEDFPKSDYKKEIISAYKSFGKTVVKTAGPAVALFAAGAGLMTASEITLTKRNEKLEQANAGLVAAYGTLSGIFNKYRENVVEKYGEEEDRKLRYSIKDVEVEETVIDSKGKEKVVKKTIEATTGIDGYSEYARFYDESCFEWSKSPEYNLSFLKAVEQDLNNKLKINKIVFLNEVYDALGIPLTEAGQEVGWVYDLNDPHFHNRIDFGIYNINRAKNRDFVNGYENVILLDFNIDGPVKKYIPLYYGTRRR